jgi:hypothetical protein
MTHSKFTMMPPGAYDLYRRTRNPTIAAEIDKANAAITEIHDRHQRAYAAEIAPLVKIIMDLESLMPPRPVIIAKENAPAWLNIQPAPQEDPADENNG